MDLVRNRFRAACFYCLLFFQVTHRRSHRLADVESRHARKLDL